jgi:hypothetical protein
VIPSSRQSFSLLSHDFRSEPGAVNGPGETETKDVFFNRATSIFNQAERIDGKDGIVLDTKGSQTRRFLCDLNLTSLSATLYLAVGKADMALRVFDAILSTHPTHSLALMGKVGYYLLSVF